MAENFSNATADLQALSDRMKQTGASASELSKVFSARFGEMSSVVGAFSRSVSASLEGAAGKIRSLKGEMSSLGKEGGASGAEFSKQVGSGIGQGLNLVGGGLAEVAGGFGSFGAGAAQAGSGLASLGGGLGTAAAGLAAAGEGLAGLGTALPAAASGFQALIGVLPLITANIPQLTLFVGIMGGFSLMGAGLAAAGTGILGIGTGLLAMAQSMVVASEGMTLMGAALPAVNAGMLELVNGLMNTEINIGGVITFVLLAASMFIMAEAVKTINEHLGPMVESMGLLGNIFTTGLMVGIVVFAAMMLILSLAMNKVATGVDKVTKSFAKQYKQLARNIPLLATSAILSNPIVGAITVALATAAGFAMGAVVPQMATGGVVSAPTYAMVGEGQYPEAVIPLGNSPQFAQMKSEIAAAVVAGLSGSGRQNAPIEVVVNIDSREIARATERGKRLNSNQSTVRAGGVL